MLITNQRLDKLAVAQADFIAREMLPPDRGPLPGATADDDDDRGPIDDEKVMADVQLARTKGTLAVMLLLSFRLPHANSLNKNANTHQMSMN